MLILRNHVSNLAMFYTNTYVYGPGYGVWPSQSHTRKAFAAYMGSGQMTSYTHAPSHTHVIRYLIFTPFCCYAYARGDAKQTYTYERSHTRMCKKLAFSSFFLLLMRFRPTSSLIHLLFIFQPCKQIKHYLKRVKQLRITKSLSNQVIVKIYQNKLKLLPRFTIIHLLLAFK